jgi:hypothetical protein
MRFFRNLFGLLPFLPFVACDDSSPELTATIHEPLAGLVAAYTFDRSATSATDVTGRGHTGTLVGGVTWTSSGKFCGALSFDGVNDRVTIADAADLDLNAAWTLMAWVRPTALSGNWRTVIMKERSTNALAYGLYANDNGTTPPAGYINVGSDVAVRGTTALPLNSWSHLALARGSNVLRLYMNGAEVATMSNSGSIPATTNPLTIGGNGPWGEWFQGQIDEVRVYGRELSAAEVLSERDTPIDSGCGGSGGTGGSGGAGGAGSGGRGGTAGLGGSGGTGQSGSGGAQGGTAQGGTAQGGTGNTGPTNLTITQSQTFQVMDGFGVSVNSASWDNGELRPALDMLVDGGSTIFRVVFEPEHVQGSIDTEPTNDNADAFSPNWCSYTPNYSGARFEELWQTIAYLNGKGITDRLMLNFVGRVPDWMGGAEVGAANLDEWVELVASIAYHGRVKRGLRFGLFAPNNEIDWAGAIEGARMTSSLYATALRKLVERLDRYGLSDLRLVGPDTAQNSQGIGPYRNAMMAEPVVMQRLAGFALHNYVGTTDGARGILDASPYPHVRLWMTEFSLPGDAWPFLTQGASALLVWDGFDSVYEHALLNGRSAVPPNDAGNGPALLSYSTSTRTYAPREEFYQFKQLAKWTQPGAVRIGVTTTLPNTGLVAFRHGATGRVTVVGRNMGPEVRLNGAGLSGYSTLEYYRTNDEESAEQQPNVSVSGGTFSVVIPEWSYFTLTGVPTGSCAP